MPLHVHVSLFHNASIKVLQIPQHVIAEKNSNDTEIVEALLMDACAGAEDGSTCGWADQKKTLILLSN